MNFNPLLAVLTILILTSCSNKFSKDISNYREEYKQDFINEKEGPLEKSDFGNLDFYPADKKYHIKSKIKLLSNEDIIMKTVSGKQKTYIPYADCSFELDGMHYALILYQSRVLLKNPMYKDYLFLPFYDNTNGNSTYGGGRYMDFKLKDIKNGYLYLDFNKCYNPWCAYSSGYNCPIPPVQNTLNISIFAGEKMYLGKHKNRSH